jgi:hypothetical protein
MDLFLSFRSISLQHNIPFFSGLIIKRCNRKLLARMFHEWLTATTDMAVLPGVLGCRTLRRTVQVRLGANTLRFPGGMPISTVSPQQFMKHPG